jgi:hypothetical protein
MTKTVNHEADGSLASRVAVFAQIYRYATEKEHVAADTVKHSAVETMM